MTRTTRTPNWEGCFFMYSLNVMDSKTTFLWILEALRDEKIRSILKNYKMKEVHDVESRCN